MHVLPRLFGGNKGDCAKGRVDCMFFHKVLKTAVRWQRPSSAAAVLQLLLHSEFVKCCGMIHITPETVIKTVSRKSIHGDGESLVFLQELQS